MAHSAVHAAPAHPEAAAVPGSLWREWEPHNLVHNAVSLDNGVIGPYELHRLIETDRALQEQVLPRLVGEERACEPGGTRLHHAAAQDCVGRARVLLAAGADPLACDCHDRVSGGRTPLVVSAEVDRGSGAVGALLVRDEAVYHLSALEDIVSDLPLLRWVAQSGKADLLAALLARGIDPDTPDSYARTALHIAADWGHTSLVKLLLDAGAGVDEEDARGTTPLHCAACHFPADAARLLLDRGADVNHRDSNGETALLRACGRGHLATVQLLLERGADASIANRYGTTALGAAESGAFDPRDEVSEGCSAVVEWLKARLASQ